MGHVEVKKIFFKFFFSNKARGIEGENFQPINSCEAKVLDRQTGQPIYSSEAKGMEKRDQSFNYLDRFARGNRSTGLFYLVLHFAPDNW